MNDYDLSSIGVLLVEPHANMRSLIRTVLRELGVGTIRDVSNAEDAFDVYCKSPLEIVLTDWSPSLDGIGLLRRIRNDEASPDPYVPIIVVSALTEIHSVYQARDAGMTEYLAKPISAALIYKRIRSVIESKRVFVRSPAYFGPDRRRRHIDYTGDDRRQVHTWGGEERRGEQTEFEGPERRRDHPNYDVEERGEETR